MVGSIFINTETNYQFIPYPIIDIQDDILGLERILFLLSKTKADL